MTSPVALEQIRRDLAASERRTQDLRDLLAVAERVYGSSEPAKTTETASPLSIRPVTEFRNETELDGVSEKPFRHMSTKTAAVEALKMQDSPISLPDLADFMIEHGWVTTAANPADTLKGALRTLEPNVFRRVSRGLYVYSGPSSSIADAVIDISGSLVQAYGGTG